MDPIVWALLFLIVGLVLAFLEVLVPSGGVLGVASVSCMITSVVFAFLKGPWWGVADIVLLATGIPIALHVAIRVWPHTPVGRRLFLKPPTSNEVTPYAEEVEHLRSLVGRKGIAKSPMMPSGIVTIEHRPYDAIGEGEAIAAGDPIVVRAVRMKRLVVRRDVPLQTVPSGTDSADVLNRSLEELGLDELNEG